MDLLAPKSVRRARLPQVAQQSADFISMLTGHTMDDLLGVLNRERQVMERLLYRLLQTTSLIQSEEIRFLHWMGLDLEQVGDHLREIDFRRTLIAVGSEGNNPENKCEPEMVTMGMLAASAPTPYRFLLEDHKVAMSALLREIGSKVAHIRDLIEDRVAELEAERDYQGPNAYEYYDDADRMDGLDREILSAGYETILFACDRLRLPELVRFLEC